MPTNYISRSLNRTGLQCILKKVNNINMDTRFNIVDTTTLTYISTNIAYYPIPTDYNIKQTNSGWETDTDDTIWVDPDLDISPRHSYDHDIIIIGVYAYRVAYTKRMDYKGLAFKMVGLEVMGEEAI